MGKSKWDDLPDSFSFPGTARVKIARGARWRKKIALKKAAATALHLNDTTDSNQEELKKWELRKNN